MSKLIIFLLLVGCGKAYTKCINGKVYFRKGDAWIVSGLWKKSKCVPIKQEQQDDN